MIVGVIMILIVRMVVMMMVIVRMMIETRIVLGTGYAVLPMAGCKGYNIRVQACHT